MNHPAQPLPDPACLVRVQRHWVDWEAIDLAEATARRARRFHQAIARGSWYLSPRYTVSCPAPTAEFFRKVGELQSAWLHATRQVLGNQVQRHLSRQVVRDGRLGAILLACPDLAGGALAARRRNPSSLSGLDRDQRDAVVQAGHLAKALALTGVLFIDGALVPLRTWQAMADQWLGPGRSRRRPRRRRPADHQAIGPGRRDAIVVLPPPPTGGA